MSKEFNVCNILPEKARVTFMRYWLTGVNDWDNYKYFTGNQTFFCPIDKDNIKFKWTGDNMYESISSGMTQRASNHSSDPDITGNILFLLKYQIKQLKLKIIGGHVVCKYYHMKYLLENAEVIRSLNPFQIDWGDIPDYMAAKDFLKLA